MDKNHFVVVKRYNITLKDKTTVRLDLSPENGYFYNEQELSYIILALRKQNIDINDVDYITPVFIPVETKSEINIVIGV